MMKFEGGTEELFYILSSYTWRQYKIDANSKGHLISKDAMIIVVLRYQFHWFLLF